MSAAELQNVVLILIAILLFIGAKTLPEWIGGERKREKAYQRVKSTKDFQL